MKQITRCFAPFSSKVNCSPELIHQMGRVTQTVREGVSCDLDGAGSLHVSRTTTRLLEEEGLQHHVLAIFRSCASTARLTADFKRKVTAKSTTCDSWYFLSLHATIGPWLGRGSRQGFPINSRWKLDLAAGKGQQLFRNSKQSNMGRLC